MAGGRQDGIRQARGNLAHTSESVGELPVDGHRVQSQRTHWRNQALSARPDRGHRAVEGIPVVERHQGVTDVMPHVAEQRGDPGNAAARTDIALAA